MRHLRLIHTFASLLIAVVMLGGEREQAAVDRFMLSRGLPQDMAVIVTDLSTGKTLAEASAERPLVPASIMKTVTIASLMHESDAEKPIVTRVYTDGPVRDGALRGNIIVEGAGDPSLNSAALPESGDFVAEIVEALRRRDIDCIEGRVIVDESIFEGPVVPPSWAKGDLMHAYGTGCHGFNFSGNASGKSSVSNPAFMFEQRLVRAMDAAGIVMERQSVARGEDKLLVEHKSLPLKEIMRSCMMRSDNLYAESMLRLFALERDREGSTSAGASEEMKFWKRRGADMKGVEIIDGSGLSRSNRMTAKMIDFVLQDMADNVDYASYLPLAGQEGTLKRFLSDTPLDSYVALKTGSMSGIQCYAGYKLDDEFAPTHSIVVIVNNFRCDRSTVRKAVEQMLLSIFDRES